MDRRRFLAASLLAVPALALGTGTHALAHLGAQHTHAIMRHALAPGTSDPAQFDVEDCRTQRNLDERGRAQARATGQALRQAGVRFDHVLSSRWCRCIETARLMALGEVTEEPALNSFFEARERRSAQTDAVRRILTATPAIETLMLVTHQVNVSALLGGTTSSGEITIFRAMPGAAIEVLGTWVIPA